MTDPLEQPGRVLTDVAESGDDVVQVEVAQCGVVLALPPHLEGTWGQREAQVTHQASQALGSAPAPHSPDSTAGTSS